MTARFGQFDAAQAKIILPFYFCLLPCALCLFPFALLAVSASFYLALIGFVFGRFGLGVFFITALPKGLYALAG